MLPALDLIETSNSKTLKIKSAKQRERERENEMEMDNKDEALKSQIAIRCANAAVRLLSLRSFPNHLLDEKDEEKETMRREITNLKIELVRERVKSRRIKLCSFIEFVLQVVTVLSASTLLLMLAFNAH